MRGDRSKTLRFNMAGAMALLAFAALLVAGAGWLIRSATMSPSASNPPSLFKTEAAKDRYLAAYDTVLCKWPVPYDDLYVPTSLGRTHVIASGPLGAPPVVLLHAALATAVVWRPNVEALSRHFRVYAVDVIGQGGRSVASRRIRTRQDYARWMNQLFDGLGIKKASIVGNSYGGFIAMNQASLAPERVDRVVLISPAGVFKSFVALLPSMAFQAVKGRLAGLSGGPHPKFDISFLLAGKGHFNPDDKDWVALGNILLDGTVNMGGMNAIMPTVFSKAELRAIRTPTLLLIAEHELLYEPRATLRLAEERMPGLQGEVVPGAHHLAAMAQPDAVDARIIAFLAPETPQVSPAQSRARPIPSD